MPKEKSGERGFAAMDGEKQRKIARKGGEAVSQNREHMSNIGRKGGATVSENRKHMAEIGRKGGAARSSEPRKKAEAVRRRRGATRDRLGTLLRRCNRPPSATRRSL